jgi:hypothetical protein
MEKFFYAEHNEWGTRAITRWMNSQQGIPDPGPWVNRNIVKPAQDVITAQTINWQNGTYGNFLTTRLATTVPFAIAGAVGVNGGDPLGAAIGTGIAVPSAIVSTLLGGMIYVAGNITIRTIVYGQPYIYDPNPQFPGGPNQAQLEGAIFGSIVGAVQGWIGGLLGHRFADALRKLPL